jgi:hypothetical protein
MKIENENYRNDGEIPSGGETNGNFVLEANENVAMKFHLIVLEFFLYICCRAVLYLQGFGNDFVGYAYFFCKIFINLSSFR